METGCSEAHDVIPVTEQAGPREKTHRKRSAGQATGFRERMFTPLKRSWLMLVVPTSYKGVALPFSGRPMLTGNRRYSYAFSKTPRLRPAKTDWHFVSTERTQKRGPEQGSFNTVLHLPRNAGILARKLLITSRFHARIPTRAVQKTQCSQTFLWMQLCLFISHNAASMFAKASLSPGISVGPEPRGWEPRAANAGH